MNAALDRINTARSYLAAGFAPVPIPERSKAPLLTGWQNFRANDDDLVRHFRGSGNIGVILGEASQGLVDIDLDCAETVALADTFLPATGAEFGRPSKARSHRLYKARGAATKRYKCPLTGATLVELRSDGGLQTVFPQSIHPSGELITWNANGQPLETSPAAIETAVARLAAAALVVRNHPDGRSIIKHAVETWPGHISDPKVRDTVAAWLGLKAASNDRSTTPHPPEAVDGGRLRYAAAAFDAETALVRQTKEGSRNDTLNVAALKLGSLVASGLLAEGAVRAALTAAALTAGLAMPEITATLNSGLRAGMAHPRDIPDRQPQPRQHRSQEWVDSDGVIHEGPIGPEPPPPVGDTVGCAEPASVKITASPYVWRNPASIPRRQWIYGRHLIRKFVSLTVAPGATGKSSLMVADALSMVTGRDLLRVTVWDGPKRVWVWNLEDPRDEIERRIVATMIRYEISPADIGDRLFLDSGRDQELCLARQDRSGTTIIEPVVDALVAELVARRIDVLVVDPFVSSHQVSENDNGAIDAVSKAWGRVAERADCAIELVHHLRKLGDAEATSESARGAVALVATARSCRVLNRMTRDEAEKAGLETHRGYFRSLDDKANLAPAPADSEWFHLESVQLPNGDTMGGIPVGNGDNIGVVVPWDWPNVLDEVTVADLVKVQKAVDGKSYRASVQAKDWVGCAVADALGLDLDKKSDKERVKALLKIWIKSSALVVTETLDSNRNKRPIVEVGNWASGGCTTSKSEAVHGGASGAKGGCTTAPPAPPPYREGCSGGGAPGVGNLDDEDIDALAGEGF